MGRPRYGRAFAVRGALLPAWSPSELRLPPDGWLGVGAGATRSDGTGAVLGSAVRLTGGSMGGRAGRSPCVYPFPRSDRPRGSVPPGFACSTIVGG